MRIIAGRFRSRILLSPDTPDTRPITDRAKQSLFDVLSPLLPDARVMDLFCGTGSLGLESLSRGASAVEFFEALPVAIKRLQANIASLGVGESVRVVRGDIFDHFNHAPTPAERFDVAFLDPPYRFLREQPDPLRQLVQCLTQRHLSPNATLVFRHDAADSLTFEHMIVTNTRRYGSMAIDLLEVAPT